MRNQRQKQCMSARPAHAAMNPRMRLAAMYAAIADQRPESKRVRFSNVKVENVVSPPQNPAVTKAFIAVGGAKRAKMA